MKLAFLGDSITECQGGYVDMVGEKLACQVLNYGIGGTRIAKQDVPAEIPSHDKDFLSRLNDIDVSADYLFVFGGVNDYGSGEAPFGELSDKSAYTFCGAVNRLISELLNKFSKEKLCFILPYKIYQCDKPNKHNRTLRDYVYTLKTRLDEEGIGYINLFDNGLKQSQIDYEEEFIADGLHPNLLGYEIISEKVVQHLKYTRK